MAKFLGSLRERLKECEWASQGGQEWASHGDVRQGFPLQLVALGIYMIISMGKRDEQATPKRMGAMSGKINGSSWTSRGSIWCKGNGKCLPRPFHTPSEVSDGVWKCYWHCEVRGVTGATCMLRLHGACMEVLKLLRRLHGGIVTPSTSAAS